MPYKSDKQRKWAHTSNGIKALGGKEKVHEWDEETKKQDGFKRLKQIFKKDK